MSADTFALALAAFFTFGCITIHEGREHAKTMTPPLALLAVSLGLFTALVALAEPPDAGPGASAGSQKVHTKSPVSMVASRGD